MTEFVDIGDINILARRLDGRGYSRYKMLSGIVFTGDGVELRFTRVQSDPFAPPSWVEVVVRGDYHGLGTGGFPWKYPIPTTTYLHRLLYTTAKRATHKCGTGNSCVIHVPRPAPIMVPRSSVELRDGSIILRFSIGLPAYGRRISGDNFIRLMRTVFNNVLSVFHGLDRRVGEIREYVDVYRDYMYIRRLLEEKGCIAFIGDGSILPRESSFSDKPLRNAVVFEAPSGAATSIDLPSGGRLRGLMICDKLTVITGGGYHGKTTLLNSIQEGIYPHVPGDGREYVVTVPGTVMVYAEDGRIIHGVDISGFIRGLPGGVDTTRFSTLNASGSTSMAASITEAVEAGANAILIDEDTSATNLLFKDRVMSVVLRKDPIKTLSQLVDSFIEETDIGVVIVSSSSSAFLCRAGKALLLENYRVRILEGEGLECSDEPYRLEYRRPRVRVFRGIKGLSRIRVRGHVLKLKYTGGLVQEIDLRRNPRIREAGQARYVGAVINWLVGLGREVSVDRLPGLIDSWFEEHGFRGFTGKRIPPDLSWAPGLDVLWFLNRMVNAVFE